MHRIYRGVSFDAQCFPADAAFLNASLEGGKGSVVFVKSGCDLGLVLDEDVVLLEVLVIGQLDGGGGRLSLSGLYALFQLMKGHFRHLPLGVSRKGVPEGGESAQVRRRGGERGGDRGTRALVPRAVMAWVSSCPEKEWCRGGSRR